jgi:hypothetical protein
MKIIYVDGTEETLGNDIEYSIYRTITTFDRIIKTKNHGFYAKWISGITDDITYSRILTVYNSQIKAIIP